MTMENDPPSTQLPPAQQPPRRRAACQPCYQSKVKCSRGQPCLRCQVAQKDCYYELASRIGKPRGSKNRTNLPSPRPGRGEEMAMTEADEGTFTSAARRHPIAPCADMIGVEGQEHTDEQQHQVPLQTLAEQSWTYSPNELNTSHFFPSFMNAGSPSRDSMVGSNFDLLSHPTSSELSPSDSFPGSISSLSEKDHRHSAQSSQHSSLSPSEPQTFSPPANLYTISDNVKPKLWGCPISPAPCTCLATLSDSLVRVSPSSASSNPSALDTFLASTSTLLTACNNFITCPLCPKNSLGLCLAATAFVTFMQLFTSLKKPPSSGTTTQGNASHFTATLTLGAYHIPATDSGAVHALMLQLTVQRWREACVGIRNLLRELGAQAEKRDDAELGKDGDGAELDDDDGGRGLWAARDMEFFRQMVQTVERGLAAFCKKGAEA